MRPSAPTQIRRLHNCRAKASNWAGLAFNVRLSRMIKSFPAPFIFQNSIIQTSSESRWGYLIRFPSVCTEARPAFHPHCRSSKKFFLCFRHKCGKMQNGIVRKLYSFSRNFLKSVQISRINPVFSGKQYKIIDYLPGFVPNFPVRILRRREAAHRRKEVISNGYHRQK